MEDVLDLIRKSAHAHHQAAQRNEMPALERLRTQMERATQAQEVNEIAKQPGAIEADAIMRDPTETAPVATIR